MKFELKDIVIDKNKNVDHTHTRGNTKLSFSTSANHQRDGACLGVYSSKYLSFI
jgi:hypothetical protein